LINALIWLQQGRRQLWVSIGAFFAILFVSFSITMFLNEGTDGVACSFLPCTPEVIDAGTGESFTAIETGKLWIGNSGTRDIQVERYYLSEDAFRMVNGGFMEIVLRDGKAWQKNQGRDWTQITPSQARSLWGGDTPTAEEMLKPTTMDGFTRERIGSGPRTSTGETTSVIRTENRKWDDLVIATMEKLKTQYPDTASDIAEMQESHRDGVLRGEFVVGDDSGRVYRYNTTFDAKGMSFEIEGTRRYGPVSITAPR
jgi:hypothetical protein